MDSQPQLLDLVVAWEEGQSSSHPVSPEELCRDCPELLPELRQRIDALRRMDAVLAATAAPPEAAVAATEAYLHTPEGAAALAPARPPSIPQYEILSELGRGGMGVVYKARHVALNRLVALKMILPQGSHDADHRRRFLREAQAMAMLQHPHIVQIHEIGQCGECPYLVMEYVAGMPLSTSLAGKPLGPRAAAEMTAVLARAVQAAHAQGVIHRDLKPANILLAADGTAKIADFGLARQCDASDATQTVRPMGTPSYMAPEQATAPAAAQGPAVDIYALGAVLYELLTGRPPFLAANPLDTLRLVVHQEPVPPRRSQPGTPRDLETICLKCLEKDARRRYATAAELADDLERYLRGEPIRARPAGLAERTWRWCRAHPSGAALVAMAGMAVLCVLATVLVYNRRLAEELARTDAARRETLVAHDRLQQTLIEEVAERIDGDLRELAAVPRAVAAMLEHRPDWSEPQLEQALEDLLREAPLIFGLAVAFEPRQWREDREDFALYVYRRQGALAAKQLLLPSYQPHYRQWPWYRAAAGSGHGHWSEPYIGEGGDRTPMVTFSAPLRRDGRLVGAVTADLAMDYFRDLRQSVQRLETGPRNYCLIVSPGRHILAHPSDRFAFPGAESDLGKTALDRPFQSLLDGPATGGSGAVRATDFSTGEAVWIRGRAIPATGWTLISVTP